MGKVKKNRELETRKILLHQRGFTLIELLLATILFSFAFFPIMDTMASSTVSLSENAFLMGGWMKARSTLERVLSETFDFMEVGEDSREIGDAEYPFVVEDEEEEKTRVIVQVGFVDEENVFTFSDTELKKIIVRLFLKRSGRWDLATTFYTLKSREK